MNWHKDTNYYGEPYDFRGKPRPMDWRDIFTLEDTLKAVRKQIKSLTKHIKYNDNIGPKPTNPLIQIRNNLRKEMSSLAKQIKEARYEASSVETTDDF